MEFLIEMDNKDVYEFLGDKTTPEKFKAFCKNAIVMSLLFEKKKKCIGTEQEKS